MGKILDPECVAEITAAFARIFANQSAFVELETLCVTHQEDRIPVYLTLDKLSLEQNSAQPKYLTLMLRNLSEEKKQNQEYERIQWFLRTTFDMIDQGITIYDSDFRLVAWNKRYESLKIFPDDFLQKGTYLVDAYKAIAKMGVFGPGDPTQAANQHIDALVNRTVKPVEELRSLIGRKIEIRRYLLPEGGLAAVFSDITDQRSAEEQLRQSQKMQTVGQLTGGIAHDFNNFLAIIIGNIELVTDSKTGVEQQRRYIDAALRGAYRASELTQRLLAFSRKQPLSPAQCNLKHLISDLMEMLRRILGPAIEVEVVMAGGLWETMIDLNQLENAIVNLAINARDSMPAGGTLTIETANSRLDHTYADQHNEVKAGRYVMLAVSDTGTGILEEIQDRVFEPFFSTKDAGQGIGLGLSMVYGFVKQSGGHITLYSEIGQGTTFKLYLPKSAKRQKNRSGIAHSSIEPRGTGESILVVEDETQVRELVQSILRRLDYVVTTAADAHEALDILELNGAFDLLLTDVVLPGGINGTELAHKTEDLFPNMKVLYMSGYTEGAVINNANLSEEMNLIGKPFQKMQLAKRVRSILDG